MFKFFFSIFLFINLNLISSAFGAELDQLFSSLKNAEKQITAKKYEKKIWNYWLTDGSSETNNQKMKIGIKLIQDGKFNDALNLFIRLSKVEPHWAEPINKMATIRYLQKDFSGSIKDINLTLKLEPRHFGAISGLAQINLAIGNYEDALKNIDYVLKIHPFLNIKELKPMILKMLKKLQI